jgi:hypothetical protein
MKDKTLSRKRDLQYHLLSWGIGFFIFLYLAGHQQMILSAVIWYGFPLFYHFVIRKQYNILYKKGIYSPRRGRWLNT